MTEPAQSKVMIRMKDINKDYRLGKIGYGTLNRDLQSWWARMRHQPDPNIKIGTAQHLEGSTLHALRDIDLTIREGERVGIIGGNGAGKSTLLKVISRVTVPTTGTMDLYGRVTSMLEVGTGFHGEMTGRENIYLNGTILGMTRSEIDRKIEEIIDFSEVREFIDTPVKRYSSGMYVKLAFSVASHLDSEIVIMDEVLAVGDEAFQQKCIDKMRQAALEENRTILYVSHNMKTIRELCERVIVLKDGQILYDGDVEDAIAYYRDSLSAVNRAEVDLSTLVRRDRNLSGICRIEEIAVENEHPSETDELVFRMRMRAQKDTGDLILRLIVCNGPGEIIGMSMSGSFEMKEGETEMVFRFPVLDLAPGSYVCDMALVSFDGTVQVRHDFLSKVMSFEVMPARRYFGARWIARAWGNIKLPETRVEEVQHGEE